MPKPGIHVPKSGRWRTEENFENADRGSLASAMSLYEIEAISNQYSFEFDRSLDKKDRFRCLKCSFCNCLFKYQVCLNQHVNTKHMVDFKELSNFERLSFIRLYLEDDRDISYAQFHNEYFFQKKNFDLLMNCWKWKCQLSPEERKTLSRRWLVVSLQSNNFSWMTIIHRLCNIADW